MWITVAMSYYGLILINTSLMTIDKKNSTTQCKMLSTDDYKSLMLTTVGEMIGIPFLVVLLAYVGRCRISFINFFSAAICFSCFFLVHSSNFWLINLITFMARMFISAEFSLLYLYTMEVYPTVIRAMALGCASSVGRIGAMVTPYLAQVLIKKTFYGTISIYIGATAISAILAFLLPIETRGRELKVRTTCSCAFRSTLTFSFSAINNDHLMDSW
jgi:hypothetical protein